MVESHTESGELLNKKITLQVYPLLYLSYQKETKKIGNRNVAKYNRKTAFNPLKNVFVLERVKEQVRVETVEFDHDSRCCGKPKCGYNRGRG